MVAGRVSNALGLVVYWLARRDASATSRSRLRRPGGRGTASHLAVFDVPEAPVVIVNDGPAVGGDLGDELDPLVHVLDHHVEMSSSRLAFFDDALLEPLGGRVSRRLSRSVSADFSIDSVTAPSRSSLIEDSLRCLALYAIIASLAMAR